MHPQILLHGSPERKPEPVPLRAGQLTLQYESGFLRYIKVGETEILRMINYYIRDHNWVTIPMQVIDEKIEQSSSGFRIKYRSECSLGEIKYNWSCSVVGDENSTITFEIEGEAKSSFKRNRLGFTVLHPIRTCAGKHCTITHSNKRQEIQKFPELISPHQPFIDIREMRWNPSDSVEAFLQFSGDTFETEDQRNWSDASYKTYCTPLSIPFPVDVKPGDKVKQTVRLNVSANKAAVVDKTQPITFSIERQGSTSFPHIGVAWNNLKHDGKTVQRINNLKLDYVRVGMDPDDRDIVKNLHWALHVAPALELVLVLDEKPNESVFEKLQPLVDRIKHIILLPATGKTTQSQLINDCVPLIRKNFPKAKIGGGTDAFFTELNRERTPADMLDFLIFSINPQAHATDDATIVENLEAQKDIVQSCRAFVANRAIHVGPVTLKMRWNPSATSNASSATKSELPPSADTRQLSMIGAAWMLGSFKYLAENNVSAITFFETCGWEGLVPHADEPWPETFVEDDDVVYPVYIILKELLTYKTNRVVKLVSNHPLLVDGVALTDSEGKLVIYLANFTSKDQLVTLPVNLKIRRESIIDEHIMNKWIKDSEGQHLVFKESSPTISIPPYSIAVLKQ